jgi:AcrR family transcriptional regulator
MHLADESGIESVIMRELGRRLGVEAASPYNHVTGKSDLLDGMADLVVAEIGLPPGGVDWKEAMRRRPCPHGRSSRPYRGARIRP